MIKILLSACLLGERVRYDNQIIPFQSDILKKWLENDMIISFCPEVAGGLPTPRTKAEIKGGDGHDVLAGNAFVVNADGKDVTDEFVKGAETAMNIAIENNVKIAILKSISPSCGNKIIYDGSFSGSQIEGQGVTTALLKQNGIRVFNEKEIATAEIVYSFRG